MVELLSSMQKGLNLKTTRISDFSYLCIRIIFFTCVNDEGNRRKEMCITERAS